MNIKKEFDNVALNYDEQRKKLIPCFEDFYYCAVNNLEFTDKDPRILDLGAGTGLLAQKVLDRYPTAEMELIDLSEKMLAVAKERFLGKKNVSIQVGDYSKMAFNKTYNAIVSSLSIHHLTDAEKVALYTKIYKHLAPSGIFVNAEQVLGEDSFLEQMYRKVWECEVEQSGLSKEEIGSAYDRVKLDKRTPLSVQLKWLKEIGFCNVTTLYQHYSFVVIYARK